MGSARSGRPPSGSTGWRSDDLRVPAEAIAAARGRARPDVRAALLEADRAGPPGPRRPAPHRRHHPGRARRHGHRALGAGRRVGLYVPGGLAMYPSTVVMNVVPAQVAGVDALVVVEPAAEGQRRPARRPGARRVRAARRRRGLRGRRRPGDRDARLRRRGDRGRRARCDAGRPDHRAGQHLGHRGQAAAARRGRHRRRGRADRDRDPRRRHRRPGARRRRPDQPGRARPAGGERAGHRRRRRWPTRSTRSWPGRWPATKHTERITHRARRASSPASVLVDDLEQGLRVVDAYAAEHLEIQTRDAAGVGDAGAQRRRDLRRRRTRRCRSATTAPAPTTCCPPAAAPGTRRGLSVQSFLRGIHVVEYDEAALRDVAPHVVTLANAEDLPAHGQAVTREVPGRAA